MYYSIIYVFVKKMLAINYLNIKLAFYPFIMNVLEVDILFKTMIFIINPNYFENMARGRKRDCETLRQ